MPWPAPVKPRPSSVVALTLTDAAGMASAAARRSAICGRYAASFGRWAMIVASMFPTAQPAAASSSDTRASRRRLEIPA